MFKVGLAASIGPGNFDFEFSLFIADAIDMHLSLHADIPVPRLPQLNPQAAVGALVDPENTASSIGSQVLDLFDPSKAHFSVAVSLDLTQLKNFIVKILKGCIPNSKTRMTERIV